MQRENLTIPARVNDDDRAHDLEKRDANTSKPASTALAALPDNVKAEHRRKLDNAAAEQSRTKTVIPSVKINVSPSGPMVLPDENDIRTMRPISPQEIAEVVKWHRELQDFRRTLLARAFDIGFKLEAWRSVMPHGQWLPWLAINVPEIHERTARRYIQLWENKDLIEAKFKSVTATDFEEIPSIRDALKAIADRKNKLATGAKKKSPSAPKTVETVAVGDRFESVGTLRLEPDQPVVRVCSECGRPLPMN